MHCKLLQSERKTIHTAIHLAWTSGEWGSTLSVLLFLTTSTLSFDRARPRSRSRLTNMSTILLLSSQYTLLIKIIQNQFSSLNYKDILEMMPAQKWPIINFLMQLPLIESNPTDNGHPRTT